MEKILQIIARELNIGYQQAAAAVNLLDDGNTVPFIARYRKEATGSLDEEQLRNIEERLGYLRNLEARRQEIISAIAAQEKLTPELEQALMAAEKLQTLEDLYLPYRPKRRTRAQLAREKGLEKLAEILSSQAVIKQTPQQLAQAYLAPEKGLEDIDSVWQGACDIVAEDISDSAAVREWLRRLLWQEGVITSQLLIDEKDAPEFLQYREYSEPVRQLPPHRILALNRGESRKALKVGIAIDEAKSISLLERRLKINSQSSLCSYYQSAIADSFKRLLLPSLEREVRNELTAKAEKQAISVFAANLRQLLLTQPICGHTILGLDPGYRTGCKAAVIDASGKLLDTATLYLTGGKQQQKQAEQQFLQFMRTYKITLIAIGNGTASYETEQFTARMLEQCSEEAAYLIVSEAGASVYSASKLAREELPQLDVSLRGAVSIARRVQDPLAELVKIEPKAIGVGQYQHDVNQKELSQTLGQVVESCVNHVGVELNTASPALLSYVSGISAAVAKNIITYRNEQGNFTNRRQLLKVSRLGPAAFTQCAGFLRISHGSNPLDNTPVHPESYQLAENIIRQLGFTIEECSSPCLQQAAAAADPHLLAEKLQAGLPTVTDILSALARPGRDPREDAPAPLTRRQVTKLSDLAIGSIVRGRVQNVVDFGVFVDIGLKVSGLIHKSELSSRYFRHPLDVVSVGDIIETEIISIDENRGRIGLSLKRAHARRQEQ